MGHEECQRNQKDGERDEAVRETTCSFPPVIKDAWSFYIFMGSVCTDCYTHG